MSTHTRTILIASALVAATLTAGCAVSPMAARDGADNSVAAAQGADGKWWAQERARDDGYGDVR